ncbi:YhcN/YlaJ family sporulation lipoprotein [Geosporobacter ferrireducens]|uniref:Sporulation protein n=1 Tax=Geosporobacter ferrireducens TaxID=1424294 RepID=A0A1D8GH37_9FIRM|nr:YhcN/YlaJ family sporulation lipoprotein [Geosporobacter ferrireducens]AOT70221.1 hypothetical protein Gferi_11820 [Geosporobacter ferrireducens]
MLKKIKLISMILAFVIFGSLAIIGCRPAQRPMDERSRTDINQQRAGDLGAGDGNLDPDEVTPDERLIPPDERVGENRESDINYDNMPMDMAGVNIETTIEAMEGIRNAVVILVEDRAYVGIETKEDIEITNMKALQSEIAAKIRETAPDITRVYMTSDQDRVKRLRIYADKFNYQRAPEEVHRELEVLF